MSDFTLSLSELERHQSSIDQVTGQVRSTVSTAQRPPNPVMYGMLMSPIMAPVMQAISMAAGQYLNGATHAMETNREQLADTRKRYEEVEEKNVELTRTIMP